ncbi:FkbM family methyltransferase [Merismopedia glauca]|uniref:FkbM family methyltransferase n=1 Tax=Merismopedia glauca CCAP 1448/3 TaxID=1296344 RepID=A0A2T1C5A3_9CYAN|nr:FkbM family methyltransferase [Merismopedia glauca]PSB03431.1 FkbM family methyltransferase [Merismopedia glauca CCAP 1448/3]
MSQTNQPQIENIIPPEIKNDDFYTAIERLSREENIKTILEIGSSSGGGSTEAFVKGILQNPNKPLLFCMEISKTRFSLLQKTYQNYDFVKCYNVSSVPSSSFPQPHQVIGFYQNYHTNLNSYPLQTVLTWLEQDLDYLKSSQVNENGIEEIKQTNKIETFDLVLIDGSEFTGEAELQKVYGAKYILLDDINTYKNYFNHNLLLKDNNYQIIAHNPTTRNGFSIFKRVDPKNFEFGQEKAEQLLLRNLVKEGMTVFDVGANLGDYSILLSQLVGKVGKVYAFEPTSSIVDKFRQRVNQANINNIYIFQNAVFSEDNQIEFNEFSEEYSVWNSIGKPQMLDPYEGKSIVPIVKTEIVDGISLDSFCKRHNLEKIDYLKIDVEGAESDVLQGASDLLSKQAISFIQFEISQKMLEGLNRKAKQTFDILIQNGYECHRIESNGLIGELVNDSESFYENYIAFKSLPVQFFTIVLNGEPFIQYHIDIFKQLPFKWHWHIVEGVADLKHDTAWSLKLGGDISDELHSQGRSNDGTTEYLDELVKQYPENITIYRQPEGSFWDGKKEMVNAPLANIKEECLLFQIDVDELWTVEQLCTVRYMFINNPEKTAAFYWCWYFVGEDLLISTRNCYAQNPQQEWLRTWKYKPGMVWAAHEPPILVEPLPNGEWKNVAATNCFSHQETEEKGLVFQHFAYVMPKQLQFKEQYYGYKNALASWNGLQEQNQFPVLLRQFLPWVGDNTMVDKAQSLGISPIARQQDERNWHFVQPEMPVKIQPRQQQLEPKIVVDGVFFQLYNTGIARVWKSLLAEWVKTGFANHVVVLDRNNTAPKIPGIWYRTIPAYSYDDTESDRQMLQQVCDEEGASLFISTYYTTPLTTPSVFMAYDMIPEVMKWDLNHPMWREKHHAIQHASSYISISENTAVDLAKFFPDVALESITVAHCGVQIGFTPATNEEVNNFKHKYGMRHPYFMLVGTSGYKNADLFLKAFAQLPTKTAFDIVLTGASSLTDEHRNYTAGSTVHILQLSDAELRLAYSGAVALVYPSKYEGFGLPVLEALACGCPVITCPNASIPEVSGEAALYVQDDDVDAMANALCEVQKPTIRNSLISAGLLQAKTFSWSKMADKVSSALIDTTLSHLNLNQNNLIIFPDWSQPEEELGMQLMQAINYVASSSEKEQTTLLIDISNTSEEEANLMLSSVAMNLLMEAELDVSEGPEISLVSNLSSIQWEALLPKIQRRIILEHDNPEAIAQAQAQHLPTQTLTAK